MNVMKRKVIKREVRAGAVMDDCTPFCLFDFLGLHFGVSLLKGGWT